MEERSCHDKDYLMEPDSAGEAGLSRKDWAGEKCGMVNFQTACWGRCNRPAEIILRVDGAEYPLCLQCYAAHIKGNRLALEMARTQTGHRNKGRGENTA